MKIYNCNKIQTMFLGKGPVKYNPVKIAQSKDNFYKGNIYTDMEKYLQKDITKSEFLKEFKNKSYSQEYLKNLSRTEQKYVNDIKMTMELMSNFDEITDKYLMEKVKKLLELHKK